MAFFLETNIMADMEYKYTSIILGKRDVGEADRIYSLYTLEGGKIQVLAKSVRKSQAKLAGYLENFTFADITVAKNMGMGKITGAVVENSFQSIRTQYFPVSRVMASLNVFNKIVDFDHRDQAVFWLLREYLEAVDSQSLISPTLEESELEEKISLLDAIFIFKLLNFLGYGIEIDACAECGRENGKHGSAELFFSAKSGGTVCKDCAKKGKAHLGLSQNAIKLMHLSLKNGIKPFMKIKASRKDIDFLSIANREILGWM